LDKVIDIPYKNAAILVSPSLYNSVKEEALILGRILDIITKNLDKSRCDYDITEENLKIKGVCRLSDRNEAFTSFTIKVFSSFLKGSGEKRYVVVGHKLSGDSLVWFPIFNAIKSALMMKGFESTPKLSLSDFRKSVGFTADETNEAVQKSVAYYASALESGYLDQKIQAVKAISHLVSISSFARRLVVQNTNLMNKLKEAFDSTDVLFRKPTDDHYMDCELQLFTTSIFASLSEDTEFVNSLIDQGVLSKCFNSIRLVLEHEEEVASPEGKSKHLIQKHNIKFWYRQSKRETARCLANIASKSCRETATALEDEEVRLNYSIISDDKIRSHTARFTMCLQKA